MIYLGRYSAHQMTERLSSQVLGGCKSEGLHWSQQKCLSLQPGFTKLETSVSEYEHNSGPERYFGILILCTWWTASGQPNHFPNQVYQGMWSTSGWLWDTCRGTSDVQLRWNKSLRCRKECWNYRAPKKTRQWTKMLTKKSEKGIGEAWKHQKNRGCHCVIRSCPWCREQLSLFHSEHWE